MKRLSGICFMAAVCGVCAAHAQDTAEKTNMRKNQALAQALFKDAANLPVSFRYGEATYHGIPAEWNPQVSRHTADSRTMRTEISGRDPQTGLIVTFEGTTYRDHPVVEWVVWFRNTSGQNLPVLRDVWGADVVLPMAGKQDAALWSGIAERHDDFNYSYKTEPLPRDAEKSFEPSGGRASDNAFPYFRVSDEQGGYTVAVGWPGQWRAIYKAVEGGVRLNAQQRILEVSLRPGERIRTPRMTVVSYSDAADAVNVWRRWYRDHALPREADGQPLRPRISGYAKRPEHSEHCKEGEASQLAFLKFITEKGFTFDSWWIDAGWYPCEDKEGRQEWWLTGDWRPDPARFPNGLRPLTDQLAKHGMGLLLWFEPERIQTRAKATTFDDKPDAWVLRNGGDDNALLNLANPETVDWLSRYISAFIKEHGISIYRQDFNFSPWGYWEREDVRQGDNRRGITENLYIQGYLRYWDYLLADNPGLWIDSCSSGGRRNDMETMRRAVPLHYSDFGYDRMVQKQRYHHMLYEWLMYFKEWPTGNGKEGDLFSITVFSPFFQLGICQPEGYDYANDKLMMDMCVAMKPYFVDGDYHLLSTDAFNDSSWTVRQFHLPSHNSGVIQCIRNEKNEDAAFTAKPKGIIAGKTYSVTDLKTNAKQTLTGEAILRDGIRVEQPPRAATVLHYE
ncbi:MAG: alpha-galactosidase [Kiritimatiellaeota bacterium]|nr:alpha-galactosidase [Kiritimatiellota bacterium]